MDGIVFIARLGSTRLTQKHLVTANGKSFIEWLVLRFAREFEESLKLSLVKMVLLTADEPENRKFESVLKDCPIEVFYGSPDNIPLRLLQCCDHYGFKNLISIDGDDILCSAESAKEAWEEIKRFNEPLIVKSVGMPLGMNVMAMSKSLLAEKRTKIGTGKLETGWGWVFDDAKIVEIKMGDYSSNGYLRFTLDYKEDAEFFKRIIEGLDVVVSNDKSIIDYVFENKVFEINKHLNDQYWINFNKQQESEKQ